MFSEFISQYSVGVPRLWRYQDKVYSDNTGCMNPGLAENLQQQIFKTG